MIQLSPPPFSTGAIEQFEQAVAQETGCKYALGTSSGTSAIHLALLALGIGPGDTVLVPTLTFCATVNPVIYCGATPVFIDCDDMMLIDTQMVNIFIKEKLKPSAIIAVDLFGNCCAYSWLELIAKEYNIPLICDSAEALGATYEGKKAGSFGSCGILSFNLNKIVTAGGGGMLVSNNPDIIKTARYYATQAKEPVPYYLHTQIGYNYRMSCKVAECGLQQIQDLEHNKMMRFVIYTNYSIQLEGMVCKSQLGSNNWLTIIEIDDAEMVYRHLWDKGIESRRIWNPLHTQPAYRGYRSVTNGTAERMFRTRLCLPSHPNLSRNDIDYICKEIKACCS